MKKLTLASLFLSTSILALSAGKEVVVQPEIIEVVEVVTPELLPEVAVAPIENIITKSNKHIYLKAGGDITSKYSKYKVNSTKISNGKTKGFGYELAIEGTQNITDSLELGLGIAYQDHNKNKDFSFNQGVIAKMAKYDSIPLYVTGKYNFNTESALKPYLKANLGYSFNINEDKTKLTDNAGTENIKTKVKNGLYTGLGAGVEYNNYLVDLMYQTNFAKASWSDEDGTFTKSKLDYSRVTLSVGYKFNI
ncbi:outer membrane beta-barrel protein [uncultured Cetobacterium sp.]|uniref:OmpW family outer membrane protein n=1 Tax=uncultured Cetobacterium sp. TaxID=527638 RepID=UPI0026047225|nr:outer membrane beta-barrel protein [uncultured Cetobacterium sp.]